MNTLHLDKSQRLELVQADTDVAITAWDRPAIELTLDGDRDQCTVERTDDTLIIASQAALALHIPGTTAVRIRRVSGDLLLRDLAGEVIVDTAHGDVSLRGGSARVSIHQIHGGLAAKGCTGSLVATKVHGDIQLVDIAGVQLGQVDGNVHARSVANDLVLESVSGDVNVRGILGLLRVQSGQGSLTAHDLGSGLEADYIAGDLSLKTTPLPGHTYRANVEGAIRARFPPATNARFDLRSSSLVSAQLPLLEKQEPTHVIGQAGEGQADVTLQAHSDLWVQIQDQANAEFDAWQAMDSISTRIEAEIAQHLGKMSVDASTQREIDKALRQAEQELAQAQRQLERETRRAQERAQRAQERAAKAARRAQERIARQSRSWGVTIDTGSGLFGPSPPRRRSPSKTSAASAEEQLAILKMLQENKISVEEAEQLLKALEG